jgi:hypothetical protein
VLSAAASVGVGVAVGGWVRLRRVRVRLTAATARPATVENLPEAARAIVYGLPQLRFRWPSDRPSFAAARDSVARLVPVGPFAASVLVWALTVRGNLDGSLEDWVRGEDA